jgi:hypothetical protein
MANSRFKIDFRKSYTGAMPVALYVRTWCGWSEIGIFQTVNDARSQYEMIKDLPEYLA